MAPAPFSGGRRFFTIEPKKRNNTALPMEVNPMRKRKQRIEPPRCPYCGRRAVLRDASYVYGSHVYNPEQKLYVCAGYPACNSYVGVHLGSLRPKGSLANGALRNKRILAHKAFDAVWQNGILTRKDAYRWLQDITGLDEQHAHTAMFSDYRCNQVIAACNRVLANHNRKEVA